MGENGNYNDILSNIKTSYVNKFSTLQHEFCTHHSRHHHRRCLHRHHHSHREHATDRRQLEEILELTIILFRHKFTVTLFWAERVKDI